MRGAIYARVACAAKERIMLHTGTLRSYAANNGIEVVGEFADDGYSGLRLDRPGLEQMRRFAEQCGFDVLLTSGPDRLARNHELLAVIMEELKGFGIETVFVDGVADASADNPVLLPGSRGSGGRARAGQGSENSMVLVRGEETAR